MADIEAFLKYDPQTGNLTWLARGIPKFDNKLAGKTAGTIRATGYLQIRFDKKTYLAHRVAWRLAHGNWPELEIDHINGDPSDNRLENLRVCTTLENRRNMPQRKNKTSKYMGVRRSKNRWSVLVNGKYCGCFADENEAGKHAAKLYADLGFHPNHGRAKRRAA